MRFLVNTRLLTRRIARSAFVCIIIRQALNAARAFVDFGRQRQFEP